MTSLFNRTPEMATRIEASRGGQVFSRGTGFYYRIFLPNDQHMFFIVTNKHVLEGAEDFRIWMHINGSTLEEPNAIPISIEINDRTYLPHWDANVDLCFVNISEHVQKTSEDVGGLKFSAFHKGGLVSQVHIDSMLPVSSVIMIGCPNGLYDDVNHIPLARRGVTATPFVLDYRGRKEFLVDIACFPGSSGSPVLLFNRGEATPVGNDDKQFTQPVHFALLGVLFAGPTMDQSGTITMNRPPEVTISSMIHLGLVLKSERLLEVENRILNIRRAQGLPA